MPELFLSCTSKVMYIRENRPPKETGVRAKRSAKETYARTSCDEEQNTQKMVVVHTDVQGHVPRRSAYVDICLVLYM